MKRLKHLGAIGFAVLAAVGTGVTADPFDWTLAEVHHRQMTFPDGTDVRYKTGHIYFGGAIGISVVIDREPFGPSDTDEVLIDAMSVSAPKVHLWQHLFVVEETGEIWGAETPTTYLRCWQPDDDFIEVDCPAEVAVSVN